MLQSQTLIRGLKAYDSPGGIPKIVWARQIWDAETTTFLNTDMGEIIVEWIFDIITVRKSEIIR